ncbi:glycosyltransferase [Yoonia sp. 76]|uniref:glycosyltransferase n=1 Tax=Yoonia sp. 76 TaxID=3081451 RepID=UPI002AFF3DF0|nr:glycosyltransferase [Yoonia sp. 76]
MAFSAGGFDSGQKPTPDEMLLWSGFSKDAGEALFRFDDGPVRHFACATATHQIVKMTSDDFALAAKSYAKVMRDFAPDVIITFGATAFEENIRQAAVLSGIVSAFYLAHPGYKDAEVFRNIDVILTDSMATQDLYWDRFQLRSTVIGKFIARPTARRPDKATRHVTFINPSYAKGVTLFYRIAEMMHVMLPSLRFLVVESRSDLQKVEKQSGIPFSQMRNIRRIGLQTDMAAVFSRTHVLIMPSLWHESGGRAAIEAISLGIPVLCSNHGGLPEHLGEGALRFDVPEPLRNTHQLIPPPSVALPWASALARLWAEPDYWQERSNAAHAQWAHHAPDGRLQLIEKTFQDCLDARRAV